MDYIQRAITGDGAVRAMAAITTDMVNEAQKTHNLSKTTTAALGRTLTAAALIGCTMKGEKDSLTIQIDGGGPAGKVIAVSDSSANVKGYVSNPEAEVPPKNGKLDVGGVVGRNGMLGIIRDMGLKEPYVGKVTLATGEIGDDIAKYFAQSEQIPSVVALGVLVNQDKSVKAAGGLIIQVMPGATDEQIDNLEKMVSELPPITKLISEGATAEDIIGFALSSFASYTMEKSAVNYKCDCSMDRIERAIASLGREEIKDIIEKQGKAEITCHFCNKTYTVTKERLAEFLK